MEEEVALAVSTGGCGVGAEAVKTADWVDGGGVSWRWRQWIWQGLGLIEEWF
jgi:hypothetical protein